MSDQALKTKHIWWALVGVQSALSKRLFSQNLATGTKHSLQAVICNNLATQPFWRNDEVSIPLQRRCACDRNFTFDSRSGLKIQLKTAKRIHTKTGSPVENARKRNACGRNSTTTVVSNGVNGQGTAASRFYLNRMSSTWLSIHTPRFWPGWIRE